MTDQNILNSVPSITVKSAQFSEATGDVYRWSDEIWRSIKDVKELVELRKANAELEKELSIVVAGLFSENDLAVRDLEQQAKGVSDFFKSHKPRISMGKSAIWEIDDVLVDEAIKALKETK